MHPSAVSRRIGKVDAPQITAQQDGGVALILKALNPVGVLMETYSRILAHRVEEKRLNIELERINREADIENKRIDRAFQLKLEGLHQRKYNIEKNCTELKKELKSKRISRMDIQKMADKAAERAMDSNISLDERRLFMDLRRELMEDIHKLGGAANALLEININGCLMDHNL